MDRQQSKFPVDILAEGMSTPDIQLEGQKVIFDKKVSLLPVDAQKQSKTNVNDGSGA